MQIHRNSSQPLPLSTPSLASEKPGVTSAPAAAPLTEKNQPSGVTYTGSQELKSMTLEDQLQYGRNMGVFTKITLHKEGVAANTPHQKQAGSSADGFVTSAVSTMKDFEEGLAALKQHSPEPSAKATGFLAEKFRGLQNVASRLNVFA